MLRARRSEPTVTDCNLILGYLDQGSLLGGDLAIDHAAAVAAVRKRLAEPLGVDIAPPPLPSSTWSITQWRKSSKSSPSGAATIRVISCSPPSAARAAARRRARRRARHRRGDLPADPGRLLGARPRRHRPPARLRADAAPHRRRRGSRPPSPRSKARGCDARPRQRPARAAAVRAVGRCALSRQSFELVVPVPPRPVDDAALAEIAAAFHDRHRYTYGHDNRGEPVQIVSVRLAAIGATPPLLIRDQVAAPEPARSSPGARSGSARPARSRPPSMTAGGCRPAWRRRGRW